MQVRLSRIRRMPEEVRRLRAPWPSLAPEVPYLTPELEREFRFGQRVALTERGFLLGGTIKGGSSSMWIPATADTYEAYLRWKTLDGFVEDGDPGDFEDLAALLRVFGIEMTNGRGGSHANANVDGKPLFRREFGQIYPILLGILKELPESHLERDELAKLQIGGWGPDAAKGSAYQDGTVYLYDFAVKGARRTCMGLFLHELGHAHEHGAPAALKEELKTAYRRIVLGDALFAIEYLLDAHSRRVYQRMSFEEFFAETHLAYTACGGALRSFIEALSGDGREAWKTAYGLFRASFEGFEYE